MPIPRRENITPQVYGSMITAELLPMPEGGPDQVVSLFERLSLVERRGTSERSDNAGERPQQRASLNSAIVNFCSTPPLTMQTPRQILAAIKKAYPKQTIETLTTKLKNGAGKPDLWIAGENGRYGMPGATAPTRKRGKASAAGKTRAAAAAPSNVIPAPAAIPGEKVLDRAFNYIVANRPTKPELLAAFATSPTPVQPNHMGIHISRLTGSRKGSTARVTLASDGRYHPLPTSRSGTAAGADGNVGASL